MEIIINERTMWHVGALVYAISLMVFSLLTFKIINYIIKHIKWK